MNRPAMVFLGTGASTPSPKRFVSAILIAGLKSTVLIDAGEGTQIRLCEVGIDVLKIDAIAITHLHGDHFLGLFPLMETLLLKAHTQKLCKNIIIIGPKGIIEWCKNTKGNLDKSKDYPVAIECIAAEEVLTNNRFVTMPGGDISIMPIPVNHGDIQAYGYILKLLVDYKRLRHVYVYISGDGVCEDQCIKMLSPFKIDVVVHECTFRDYPGEREKARIAYHATVYEVANLAAALNAKLLVITHTSSRYDEVDLKDMVSRIRRIYDGQIVIAQDLLVIPLYMI